MSSSSRRKGGFDVGRTEIFPFYFFLFLQPMSKRIQENPRYKHIKPVVDSGNKNERERGCVIFFYLNRLKHE